MQDKESKDKQGICSCISDPFAGLPPELRPRPRPKKSNLRKATCPGCGLNYWTSRSTDVCMQCEKQGVKATPPSQS